MALKIYLAGPEVFLPNAREMLDRKAAMARSAGFVPLSPDDVEIEKKGDLAEVALAIGAADEAMMLEADAIIANLTPWRGVSADAGTVYELGFMCALGKIVYAYTNVAASHFERVRAHYGEDGLADGPGMWRGPDGLRFEDFGMMDNLMLQGGVERRGGKVVIGNAAPDALYTDTTAFAKCLSLLARPDER